MSKSNIIDKEELLAILQLRFENNMQRHPNIQWSEVIVRLQQHPIKMKSLLKMEQTGGEPDVVAFDENTNEYLFYDCSSESPSGRRSICYDKEALASRKEHKPYDSAINMAESMGINILGEEEYKYLQSIGKFDLKTSSWIKTPTEIRNLGGALFADRRYNQVFIYHNSASSYYESRGFRGVLRI